MLEISILHDPIMELIVFLTVLISSLTEEELCNFFHFSILTENVYWKLLKYKLTMLILTQNMQIFIELWYESLICVTRVAMRTNCYWKPDPIIFLFFFKDIDRRPAIISFKYFIILTFSGEIFAWIWFCEPIFQAFNFPKSLLKWKF